MTLSISAVVFDFDGVIVETEEADYLAWREIWARFGLDLGLDQWAPCIGTRQGYGTFSAFGDLCRLTGLALDEGEIEAEQRRVVARHLTGSRPLPGVLEWLDGASSANLAVAVASSSSRSWVEEHLHRVGLTEQFPVISCFDDCGAAKPDPASYLLACAAARRGAGRSDRDRGLSQWACGRQSCCADMHCRAHPDDRQHEVRRSRFGTGFAARGYPGTGARVLRPFPWPGKSIFHYGAGSPYSGAVRTGLRLRDVLRLLRAQLVRAQNGFRCCGGRRERHSTCRHIVGPIHQGTGGAVNRSLDDKHPDAKASWPEV